MQSEIQSDVFRLEEQNRQINSVREEQTQKQQIRDNLRAELATDQDFLAKDEQEKRLHALEYKKDGLITGLGSNFFKLAGSVILYGIISSFILVIVRLIIGG